MSIIPGAFQYYLTGSLPEALYMLAGITKSNGWLRIGALDGGLR